MLNKKCWVTLSGSPGTGKTTLVHLLNDLFSWEVYQEKDVEYLYVNDFYADMQRWSFNHELQFIFYKFRQQESIKTLSTIAIQDMNAYESYEVFARNLFNNGLMSARDFRCLTEFYNWASAQLPFPDLIVYLTAPVEVLLERIKKRGRVFEQEITNSYLADLENLYKNWIQSITFCPVLTIDTTQIDVASVAKQVWQAVDKITSGNTIDNNLL